MSWLTLEQVEALLPGGRRRGPAGVAVSRVHTDSRSVQPGDLFVALAGERFDAHDFLPQVKAAGAVAALACRGLDEAGLPGVVVDDTLKALQVLARGWRQTRTLPLIAVTGSNGKTTVTQMIASILRAAAGDLALATAGNLNNHIGVPLTLLRLREHRLAVVELGMNHPGEIALLADLARPTVALVNNAQREHLEFMGTVEAVARENGGVIEALGADGVAVFPSDDAYTPLWKALAGTRRVMRFGNTAEAEVQGTAEWAVDHWRLGLRTPAGPAEVALRIAGRHNVRNALAATACALAAGVPLATVVQGLNGFQPVQGRSQLRPLVWRGQPRTLVDDTYNANPDSMAAAIEVLAELPGPRWLVMGDMGEVGEQGPAFHAESGALAAARGLAQVWCVGALSAHAASAAQAAGAPVVRHFETVSQALDALAAEGPPDFGSVLVKGSRFMRMEQVVQALQAGASLPSGDTHAA